MPWFAKMVKFCVLVAFLSLYHMAICQQCVQTDSCSCRFDDEDASIKLGINDGIINLHGIADDGEPVLFDDDKTKSSIYFYTPCSTYPCTSDKESAVCLAHSEVLGDLQQAKFYTNTTSLVGDKPKISIIYPVSNSNTSSQVDLVCSESTVFKFEKKLNSTAYLFTLSSPCACIDGCLYNNNDLSTGSILVIIFISALLIYLGTGCLYRKAVLGATGQEVIPNHQFWVSLPGLVKDGYLFFLSPCLGDRASGRVYEQL